MASLVWLGAVLGILASMSGTTGKQLLRFSELQRLKGTKGAHCVSRVSLVLGLVLNVAVGPLIDMAAYAFAPQSVIAPLGGLDVVWNTVTAPCTLGEKLTPTLVVGCLLIAGGAVSTSCVGAHEEQAFTPDALREALFRWPVFAYCCALAAWLAFNILVLMPRSAAPKGQPFASGDRLRGLSLGVTAGSIAGNMFCVKAFAEFVQASIRDRDAGCWVDWLPYVLLLGALFFSFSNLHFLVRAMQEYEALFMGAVFEGSLITAACISGTVVFSELQGLRWWACAGYWLSVLAIIGGILLVAMGCLRSTTVESTKIEVGRSMSITSLETADTMRVAELSHCGSLERSATRTGTQMSLKSVNSQSSRTSLKPSPFRGVPLVFEAVVKSRSAELQGVVVIS